MVSSFVITIGQVRSNSLSRGGFKVKGRRGFKSRIRPRIPACRKRRLKGRRYIAIVADTA